MAQKSLYPRFLLRNYCVLAFLAGLIGARFIYPGVVVLGLIILLSVAQQKRAVHAFFICLTFIFGLTAGNIREQQKPLEPAWLVESMGDEIPDQRPQALYVEGRVKKSEIYADGRIRLLVDGLVPLAPPVGLEKQYEGHSEALRLGLVNSEGYAGTVSVTLWQATDIPLAGQTLRMNARFARVRGFANPGVFTIDDYWQDRGVWIRGWNVGGKHAVPVEIGGEPDAFAKARHDVWVRFVRALPGMPHSIQGQTGLDVAQKTAERLLEESQDGTAVDPTPAGPTAFLSELASIQGTGQAFLAALVFGDRSGFTPYQKELLSKATLTHSMALSGLHLTYVALVGIGLALCISKFFPAVLLYLPRPKLCFIVTLPLALGYLWIGGAPLSLVRSALMLFFFGLILFGNRAQVLIDGLFAAVFLITLIWPRALFDLSLQLSALSVGAIALFFPLITKVVQALIPKVSASAFVKTQAGKGEAIHYARGRMRAALTLLLMSLCIQLALSPLLIQVFGSIGLWFPLNLLWLPVLGTIVMPLTLMGLACVIIGWEFGAHLLLYGASLPCDGLMWLLQRMDAAGYLVAPLAMRPHWLGILGIWVTLMSLPLVVVGAWNIFRKHKPATRTFRWAMVGCCAGIFVAMSMTFWAWHHYKSQDVSVALLDVGQGQAIVVSWPGGRSIVDGGGFPQRTFDVGKMVVGPYLTAQKPAVVDWLINSHPDYDHLGGMLHILESFTVRKGFAGNGDRIQGQLKEEFERIRANRKDLAHHVWGAGDKIVLWGGGLNAQRGGSDTTSAKQVFQSKEHHVYTTQVNRANHVNQASRTSQANLAYQTAQTYQIGQTDQTGQTNGTAWTDGRGLSDWHNGTDWIDRGDLLNEETQRVQGHGESWPKAPKYSAMAEEPDLFARFEKSALGYGLHELNGPQAFNGPNKLQGAETFDNDGLFMGQSDRGAEGTEHNALILEVLWPPKGTVANDSTYGRNSAGRMEGRGQGGNEDGNGADIFAGAKGGPPKNAEREENKGGTQGQGYAGNDASLVLRLVWQGKGLALLCGDIGKKSVRDLLASTPPQALQAEVLVLPHHGSKSSFSKALYEAVNPRVVLASCGYKNVWGFPNIAIRETLQSMDKPLYSTAEHGMIKVRWPQAEAAGHIELTRQNASLQNIPVSPASGSVFSKTAF